MWDSSVGKMQSAESPEQLPDKMIEVLKNNIKENPDFSALLFEMWVSARRSSKIRKVFNDGMNEAVDRLKTMLGFASNAGIINVSPEDAEGTVRVLLAMYHGLAIQFITSPEKIDDRKMWAPIKRMLLSALGGK